MINLTSKTITIILGILFILLGLSEIGLSYIDLVIKKMFDFWPLILVIFGITLVIRKEKREYVIGFLLISMGVGFIIDKFFHDISIFGTMLLGLGIGLLLKAFNK